MDKLKLEPRIVRMSPFGKGEWLQSRPFSRADLRGKVVLLDFWDYSCLNCVRTFPYLRAWHQRYAAKGLQIIGVHAPEFRFAKVTRQIEAALAEHELPYPTLLDNEYETWERFAVKAWPTKVLIDADGYVRLTQRGEGHYLAMEQAIQQLLKQRDPAVELPPLLPPLRDEDASGAVCYRPTPELYAGYSRGGLFGAGLGNPEGYVTQGMMIYQLPALAERDIGRFYLAGAWQAWPEAVSYAGQSGGQVVLPYEAVGVNAILSPSADEVETMLGIMPTGETPLVAVRQNGRFLTPDIAGQNVTILENGRSVIHVDRPKMYQIVDNQYFGRQQLTLTFESNSLALYTFTFTTCLASAADAGNDDLLHMP